MAREDERMNKSAPTRIKPGDKRMYKTTLARTKPMFRNIAIAVIVLLYSSLASAMLMTAPETEMFILGTSADFSRDNDDGTLSSRTNSTSPADKTLTFDMFDGTLGILTGVLITFESDYDSTATIEVDRGTSSDDIDIEFFAEGSINLLLSGGLIMNAGLNPAAFSASCVSSGPLVDCSSSDSIGSMFNGSATANTLSSFIGLGTFDLNTSLTSMLAPRTDPDNDTMDFVDNTSMSGTLISGWNGSVSVVYEYEERGATVPEPTTLYLLVLGLGGISFLTRRRRSRIGFRL
jgi:hypothetical protein